MTSDAQTSYPRNPAGIRWTFRIAAIVFLGLLSLIPLLIVDGVADERRRYFFEAQSALGDSWGRAQSLSGPVLVVPVTMLAQPSSMSEMSEMPETQNGRWRRQGKDAVLIRKHLIVLPDELQVKAQIDHEMRTRAIYEIALFSAELDIKGRFENLSERISERLENSSAEVDWDGIRLVLGISDPRAIRLALDSAAQSGARTDQPLQWNSSSLALEPGEFDNLLGRSVQASVVVQENTRDATFNLALGLGSTESFSIGAIGGTTTYDLAGSWLHPGFGGAHSPVRRSVSEAGFTAHWQVHGLARSLPDAWFHEDQRRALSGQEMSVVFHNPVMAYTAIDRGIKYGLVFIALTFLTFFCIELTVGISLHIVQYAVVSLGLIMFYMTLLAASEHLSFLISYGLSSLLIVSLLGAYTWAMTGVKGLTGLVVAVLLMLYVTLFVLLQLEDFALLVGTLLLLVGLAALMFATRNLHRQVAS